LINNFGNLMPSLKFIKLHEINKIYFGYEDVVRLLGIAVPSTKVAVSRYPKQGLRVRVKGNIYMPKEKWLNLDCEQKFIIAKINQVAFLKDR